MRRRMIRMASDNAAAGTYEPYPTSTWAQAGGRNTAGTEPERILTALIDFLVTLDEIW